MRRRPVLLLALSSLAGCAIPPATPAARYAGLCVTTYRALGRMLDHLAARERIEADQAAALRFAATAGAPRSPTPPAVPAAGAVLQAGMALVVIDAQRLAALAGGTTPGGDTEAASALASLDAALAALRAVTARWPAESQRRRGLAGFRALAAPVPAGTDTATLARMRQDALADGIALLQAVMGEDPRAGLRGALTQRHEAWRAAQRGLLAGGARMDAGQRMALWNRVQAALAADGFDIPAAEVVRLLAALPPAHAGAGAGDAAGVEALAAALARFDTVLAQAR